MKDTPKKTKVEHVSENWHGYEGWNTYTIRDAKTNVCLAVVGEVDRYFQDEYKQIAADLSTAYNQRADMEAAIKELADRAESMASMLNSMGFPAYYLEAAPKIKAARKLAK